MGGYPLGEYDVLVVFEAPDDTTAASIVMAPAASGAVKAAKTTRWVSGQEWIECLRKAQGSQYRPTRSSHTIPRLAFAAAPEQAPHVQLAEGSQSWYVRAIRRGTRGSRVDQAPFRKSPRPCEPRIVWLRHQMQPEAVTMRIAASAARAARGVPAYRSGYLCAAQHTHP